MSTNAPLAAASPWFTEHLEALRSAALLGPILDLACGRGRHALALTDAGIPVLALDRNLDFLAALAIRARDMGKNLIPVRCDLEAGHGIPVEPGACGAILVFRFLYRPLANAIEETLRPGGILLYESFALAHRETGRGPRRKEFFLAPEELPALFPNLEVISYAEGPDAQRPPDITARLLARKPV